MITPTAPAEATDRMPADASDRGTIASLIRSRHPGPGTAADWYQQPGATPMLAPRLATCYKIAMGLTMGYMLILML